jgi:hypothetical protein
MVSIQNKKLMVVMIKSLFKKIKSVLIILFLLGYDIVFAQNTVEEAGYNYKEANKFITINEQSLISSGGSYKKGFKTMTSISEYMEQLLSQLKKDTVFYDLINYRNSILLYIEKHPSKHDMREMTDEDYTKLIYSEEYNGLSATYNGFSDIKDMVKALIESEKYLRRANSALTNLHKYNYDQIILTYPFMKDNYPTALKWDSAIAAMDSRMASEIKLFDSEKSMYAKVEKNVEQNKIAKAERWMTYNGRKLSLVVPDKWVDPYKNRGVMEQEEERQMLSEYENTYSTHKDYVTKAVFNLNDTLYIIGSFRDLNKYTRDLDVFVASVDKITKSIIWFKIIENKPPEFKQSLEDDGVDITIGNNTIYALFNSSGTFTSVHTFKKNGDRIGTYLHKNHNPQIGNYDVPLRIHKDPISPSQYYIVMTQVYQFSEYRGVKYEKYRQVPIILYCLPDPDKTNAQSSPYLKKELFNISGSIPTIYFEKDKICFVGNYTTLHFEASNTNVPSVDKYILTLSQGIKNSLGRTLDNDRAFNIFYMKVNYNGKITDVYTYDSEEPNFANEITNNPDYFLINGLRGGDPESGNQHPLELKINKKDGKIIK